MSPENNDECLSGLGLLSGLGGKRRKETLEGATGIVTHGPGLT